MRRPVEPGPASALGRPLLTGAEVVHVAEEDVVHRLALRHGHREREERDPALGVERAVDRVDHDPQRAVARQLADLLGDDRGAVDRAQALEDHPLCGRVDGRRLISADSVADDGLALRPGRELAEHAAHVLGRRAADRQPVVRHESGRNSRPLTSFG